MKVFLIEKNKKYLLFQIAFFLLCFCFIAYLNRFTGDDFCGIAAVNKYGILGASKNIYLNWEGSYTQGLIYYFFCFLFQHSGSLLLYNVVILFLLIFSLSFFLFAYFKTKSVVLVSITDSIIISLVLICAFYFTTTEFGEIWYWLCGSSSYLLPVVFLFMTGGFFIKHDQRILPVIAVVLFTFIFSGFRINYTISLIAALVFVQFFVYRKNKKTDHLLFIVLITAIVGFVIFMAAPGNAVRLSRYNEGSGISERLFNLNISTLLKGISGFIFIKMLHTFYIIVILFPLIVFGIDHTSVKNKTAVKQYTLIAGGFFAFLMLVNFLLLYLITGSYFGTSSGSYRTLFLLDISWVIFIALLLFYCSLRLKDSFRILLHSNLAFKIVMSAICVLPFSAKICFANRVLPAYAFAYDKREEMIKNALTKKQDEVILNPLPNTTFSYNLFEIKTPGHYLFVGIPGNLLFLADAKKDSLDWVNTCMGERYNGIKIKVR